MCMQKKPQLYILYLHNCKYIARKKSGRNYDKLSQCGVDWIGVTFKWIFNCTVWSFFLWEYIPVCMCHFKRCMDLELRFYMVTLSFWDFHFYIFEWWCWMAYSKFIGHPKSLLDCWFISELYLQFRSEVSRLFLKGPGSKYFRLCGPKGLCWNRSTLQS